MAASSQTTRQSAALLSVNLRGILYMCAGSAIFPLLNASVKYLSAEFATPQIVWARYLVHMLVLAAVLMPRYGTAIFRSARPGMQVLRSLLLLCSTAFYFFAVGFIPLTTAAAISFTSPFIVTALSPQLLGEKVGLMRWLAVAGGFAGALVVIRPGFDGTHWTAFLVVGSAGCFALYGITTRWVSGHDDAVTTVFYTALVGAAASSLVGPFFWTTPVEPLHWLLFAGMGVVAGIGHYFVVKAFQYGEASVVAPFGYAQLIGATALGWLIWGDIPDLATVLGTALIIACGVFMGYRESRRRHG